MDQNNNPYDDENYKNPSFPNNPPINSGSPTENSDPYGQNPYAGDNGQEQYGQNPYAQQNDQGQYAQNPYARQNDQGQYAQNPYGQQSDQGQYAQNPYGQYPTYPSSGQTNGNAKRPATGMEIASLVLGILSITCCAGVGLGGLPAIIGLIVLAISKGKTKTYSGVGIGGLVCCILGLIVGIVTIAILVGTGFLTYYMETGRMPDFMLIFMQ